MKKFSTMHILLLGVLTLGLVLFWISDEKRFSDMMVTYLPIYIGAFVASFVRSKNDKDVNEDDFNSKTE